jgi:sugar phosphate isomerase/epimerase
MKRREFLQRGTMVAASAAALPSLFSFNKAKKTAIGLQLYTLRDVIPNDPQGVLKKIAAAGYNILETYAYSDGKIFGMTYGDFSKAAKDLGMKITSGHYPLTLIKDLPNWEKAVVDAKSIGQDYMVMPYIMAPDRTTIDDYKKICASLNKAGEVCNKHGIRFGYHNHDFEFIKVEDQVPYDVMLKELDPKLVSMEIDLYWVVYAGIDPLKYFAQYPGRFEQWHVKDMDKADRKKNAEVGSGSIDFKALFAKSSQAGLKHFYVEQESYKGTSLESIKPSADYLKTIV